MVIIWKFYFFLAHKNPLSFSSNPFALLYRIFLNYVKFLIRISLKTLPFFAKYGILKLYHFLGRRVISMRKTQSTIALRWLFLCVLAKYQNTPVKVREKPEIFCFIHENTPVVKHGSKSLSPL